MVGITLTEGPDVYFSTLRSPDPGIPIFEIRMLGGNDQLYTSYPSSLRAYLGSGDDYARFGMMYDLFVYGESGNDTIDFMKNFLSLTLDAGDGADRVNFFSDPIGTITATGGAGNDSFYGNGHQFYGTINGGIGDDYFAGFGNHGDWKVTLAGGTGNDTYLIDPAAPPTIIEAAGAGTDTIILLYAAPYTAPANIENVIVQGSVPPPPPPPSNTITGDNLDNVLSGGSAADSIYGLGGNDVLRGYAGNDLLDGGTGNDRLFGGIGADKLYGGDGADLLRGDAGRDEMWGGAGADGFIFDDANFGGATTSTCDIIHDFSAVQGDKIRLNLVDANEALIGDQAFTFIGTAGFGHVAGQLRYQQIGGNTYLQGDTDGDAVAEFFIQLDGLLALNSAAFIL